jgi:hypothetical protein
VPQFSKADHGPTTATTRTSQGTRAARRAAVIHRRRATPITVDAPPDERRAVRRIPTLRARHRIRLQQPQRCAVATELVRVWNKR